MFLNKLFKILVFKCLMLYLFKKYVGELEFYFREIFVMEVGVFI